ncbi:Fanconi anemia group J protein homolog isoform X2 [Dreissena polymorpha]|uniref:Fanconi anemia group J protein homolog isoform X2 n=1 Tax=Dreissena polymorpha TaxID=45954 RepID=UPI0022641DF6|nr:Fanconi anemia group J protein homolog isoform X2 [Dreissena polymorpha]
MMATSSPDERTIFISGVKVVFPCKPYPSQFSMMDKVIKGLERRQNSLLESPTGSGKSLALLCSALAWQNAQHERITQDAMRQQSDACCKSCQCKTNKSDRKVDTTLQTEAANGVDNPIELSDEEDFKPAKKPSPKLPEVKKRGYVTIAYEESGDCTCGTGEAAQKRREKVPKIYFGTRTHKQIAQITRELRKTAYHDARMVILASREYTCINPNVTKLKNKSEGCREKLDGPGCKFNDRSKRVFLTQGQLQSELPTAWDLEDLVSTCTVKKACPYFVTHNVIDQADIVFCPYNYLIDPLVRKSMEINLKDQIVILDEAHNLEDSSRDAASGSITTEQISSAIHNLQELLENNVKFPEHLKIRNMLESLLGFLQESSEHLQQADYDSAYKVWSGFDIVARLKNVGLGPDNYKEVERSFEAAISSDEDVAVRDRRNQLLRMSSSTGKLLEQLFQILHYMYREDLKYVEDYRVCVLKSTQFVPNRDTGDRWLGKNRRGGSRVEVLTLNFWCMNPAVAFSDFSVCRNVVLSSGTLSPMSTFASELGTEFPIQLEANHIIEDKQVSVNAIGVGPSGHTQLQAVYKNMETLAFQDELGRLIHRVCQIVPHGVLCFLPSYRALETFSRRWKLTGLWKELCSRKRVMMEPRSADREEFDGMMQAFYDVVSGDTSSSYVNEVGLEEDTSGIDGALFFAVCRGKVSEGMDFADNNARAVITVGIPFPNFKDLQVKLKREYNDQHRAERGLLSGADWYEIQAFRALNQALGRCIRHRKDWGALIMVDDRFVKNKDKYSRSLSRWVRCKVRAHNNFREFEEALVDFTERMQREMLPVSADTSFIPSTPISGRCDSVYKRKSLDNTVGCSPSQASPYFSPSAVENATGSRHQSPAAASSLQLQSIQHITGNQLAKESNSDVGCLPTKQGHRAKQLEDKIQANQCPGKLTPIVPGPTLVYKLTPSTLPPEEQLRAFLSSKGVPKAQSYYVVCNEGKPNESAFFIEPNMKNKSEQVVHKDSPKQMEPDSSTVDLPLTPQSPFSTGSPAERSSLLTAGTALTTAGTALPTAGTALPTSGTAFLTAGTALTIAGMALTTARAALPTSGAVLPTAGKALPTGETAVLIGEINFPTGGTALSIAGTGLAPNRQVSVLSGQDMNTNETAATDDDNVVTSSRTVFDQHNNFLKFCQLPVSRIKTEFSPAALTQLDVKQELTEANISTAAILDTVVDTKPDITKFGSVKDKKPIFKKRLSVVNDLGTSGDKQFMRKTNDTGADIKDEIVEPNTDGNKNATIVGKIKESEESMVKGKSGESSGIRGHNSKSVVEKLRMLRRQSKDNANNTNTLFNCNEGEEVVQSVPQELAVVNLDDSILDGAGSSENSDEEFLNTRRRGARKRKSTSKYEDWAKRSKKGVKYKEEGDSFEKENYIPCKHLMCASCGKKLLNLTDYERRKRHPGFVEGVFKKNTELLYFCDPKLDMAQLAPVTAQSHVKGVRLNSMYDSVSGCCTEFLRCVHCEDNPLLGVRVLLTDSSSTYKTGQTWLVSSAVKMQ